MNMRLKDVVITAANGMSFNKHPVAFIRGNNIKSIQLPTDIIDRHIAELKKKETELKAMRAANMVVGDNRRGGERSSSAGGRGRGGFSMTSSFS